VKEFENWLLERPESRILVYSHSGFLAAFLNDGKYMDNCEIRVRYMLTMGQAESRRDNGKHENGGAMLNP